MNAWTKATRGLAAIAFAWISVTAPVPPARAQDHLINLKDADIQTFIDDVSAVTGYSFITHPAVSGTVTVTSQTPLTTDEVFQLFLGVMRTYGYVAIPTQTGAYRIVPASLGAQDAGAPGRRPGADQLLTRVFRLDNVRADQAAQSVRELISENAFIGVALESNAVVVSDYAGNLSRIGDVLRVLDEDKSVIRVVGLTNMAAPEAARLIVGLTGDDRAAPGTRLTATPTETGNTLLLRGEPQIVTRYMDIIRELDAEARPNANLRIIRLVHADGLELIPVLERVGRVVSASAAPSAAASAPVIAFHEPTNTLVITADSQTLESMEEVIAALDVRRQQVLLEAIIVELSDTAARELGLQFFLAGSQDSQVPFISQNFSASAANILPLAGALVTDADEDNPVVSETAAEAIADAAVSSLLSLSGITAGFGGQTDSGTLFGAILNAVQDDASSNVLSVPQVLTLDNQPASLSVGQEIPISTGEGVGSDLVNPFRTINRQEVGVQLDVTPQISEGDSLVLEIRQEVSSIEGPLVGAPTELITNLSEIQTTVLADNKD
ncbi:MAG: type II secretion system secretin GspD, partial [Maricaulaceae bacterium]